MGPGGEIKNKFHGPYRIVKIKFNDTYDVTRLDIDEGALSTSTWVEFIKLWARKVKQRTSGADVYQDDYICRIFVSHCENITATCVSATRRNRNREFSFWERTTKKLPWGMYFYISFK